MAVKMVFDYDNARNLLAQSIKNEARPIVILEASASDRVLLNDELFSKTTNSIIISFSDFLMKYVYSIKNQNDLLSYSYIVIDDVNHLYGMSGTLKILSTFIDNMISHNVAVIFMGDNISHDMCEVTHMIGSKIHYIIKVEEERI